jgi:hypothetical protein
MIRDHYRNTDIRKAELDPSTFADPANDNTPRNGRWILAAFAFGALCWVGVIWGAVAIFK